PIEIPRELQEALEAAARAMRVPLKSVLLAAHCRVLQLLTGQLDILTGLVMHGRPEEVDGDRTLGLFLNVIPFRLNAVGPTVHDLVRAVFDAEQELMPFRWYPDADLGGETAASTYAIVFNFTHFHVVRDVP